MLVLVIKKPKGDKTIRRVAFKALHPKKRPKLHTEYLAGLQRVKNGCWYFHLQASSCGGARKMSLTAFSIKEASMPARLRKFCRQLSKAESIPYEVHTALGELANRMAQITVDGTQIAKSGSVLITLRLGTYRDTMSVSWAFVRDLYALDR